MIRIHSLPSYTIRSILYSGCSNCYQASFLCCFFFLLFFFCKNFPAPEHSVSKQVFSVLLYVSRHFQNSRSLLACQRAVLAERFLIHIMKTQGRSVLRTRAVLPLGCLIAPVEWILAKRYFLMSYNFLKHCSVKSVSLKIVLAVTLAMGCLRA